MNCRVCSDAIPTARVSIGYVTCLPCGDTVAKERSKQRQKQNAPLYNKGPYGYITINDTKTIGR